MGESRAESLGRSSTRQLKTPEKNFRLNKGQRVNRKPKDNLGREGGATCPSSSASPPPCVQSRDVVREIACSPLRFHPSFRPIYLRVQQRPGLDLPVLGGVDSTCPVAS